tara:strand:- start:249 stop:503 length:255 start_codon:yes stop_codon:yes gene_type:complete
MGWVTIKDGAEEDTLWAYENTATASDTYSDTVGSTSTYSGGIRTFTYADGHTSQNYVKCRKVVETTDEVGRGELSKTFYDALNA